MKGTQKRKGQPRPIRVEYYAGSAAIKGQWLVTTHATTVPRASRAAFQRLLGGQAGRADVYDANGALVAVLRAKVIAGVNVERVAWEQRP